MNIQLINGKQDGFTGKNKIYIGRANRQYNLKQSPLANPYSLIKDGNRDQVIQLYRKWLWWQISGENDRVLLPLFQLCDRIKANEETILTCWCHPKPCHGDVIIRCVNWMMTEEYFS